MLRFILSTFLILWPLGTAAEAPLGTGLVRIDVLDGGALEDGSHQAAIRLRLADGWKTYWRAPGDAGIPPSFDWRGSHNIGDIEITWPTPIIFDQNGMRSIGYKDEVILPLRITPKRAGLPMKLAGEVEFGICKDVCIPSELPFSSNLEPSTGRNPLIAASLAQAPFSAKEAGVTGTDCSLKPSKDGLLIEARVKMPPIDGREVVVFEPSDPALWSSEPRARWQGSVLLAESELLHATGQLIVLDRSTLIITVIGKGRSVEIRGCPSG